MRSLALAAAALLTSTAAVAQYEEIEVKDGGSIEGRITYNGRLPTPKKITITKDIKVCGSSREDIALEVSGTGGVKNVVVYLTDIKTGKKSEASMKPVLDQRECRYVPHTQVVPLHASLQLKSSDPILHNVHSFRNGATAINVALPPQKGLVLATRLDKPGGEQLKCDVHSFMRGGVFVAENPYWALTNAEGKYAIKDVPPGTYTVSTWHETAGPIGQKVTVAAGAAATFDGKVR
ncbi:MAG: hypothetical protein NVS2B9_15700 [Myxococcales bacterium]